MEILEQKGGRMDRKEDNSFIFMMYNRLTIFSDNIQENNTNMAQLINIFYLDMPY